MAIIAVAVVTKLAVGEAVAIPKGDKLFITSFNGPQTSTKPTHNLRHIDFVQLHGFLGLTPAGSKGIGSSSASSFSDSSFTRRPLGGGGWSPPAGGECAAGGAAAAAAAWARAAAAAGGSAALGSSGFNSLDLS